MLARTVDPRYRGLVNCMNTPVGTARTRQWGHTLAVLDAHLARDITKAASAQTYWTIGLLVDRARVDDAYRAYAYFRWLDDSLDARPRSGDPWCEADRTRCRVLLDRQQRLLEGALRGETVSLVDPAEGMLVDLVRSAETVDDGLESYLRHMMDVMEFDVRRRGRLVSRLELDTYTRSLATAVTDAMHHFIGRCTGHDGLDREMRYLGATGAHVVHMLRDTKADLRAGYINIPREVLDAGGIGPADTDSDAYRAWVRDRVALARRCFAEGRAYVRDVRCGRFRLAGLAYIARFEWLLDAFERDDYRLRADYGSMAAATALQTGVEAAVRAVRRPGRRASRWNQA